MAFLHVKISKAVASDVCSGSVKELDACLSIGFNDVSIDQWAAWESFTDYTIVSASFDIIFLNRWLGHVCFRISNNSNSIIVRLLDRIFEDNRSIVDQLNCHHINLHFVHGNKGINFGVTLNTWALADHKYVMHNHRLRTETFNVKANCWAWYNGVLSEYKYVLRLELGKDTSAHKLMKLTILDKTVSLDVQNSSCRCLAHPTSSEWAALNETCGIW